MALNYAITTLAELRTRVRERIIPTFWTDTELNDLIKEALRVWNALTGFYRRKDSVSFAANETHYVIRDTIASDCFAVLRVENFGPHLDPTTVEELGQFNPTWQEDTTVSSVLNWIPMGLHKMALYPKPTATYSVVVDSLIYAPLPSADGDYIQIAEEDINSIIDYVQFALVLKEGGEELKQALPLLQNFLVRCAKQNSKLLKSAIFRRFLGMPMGGQSQPRPRRLEKQSFR